MPEIFTKNTPAVHPPATGTTPPVALVPQGHPLSSFCVVPKDVVFHSQGHDEQTILLLRPHVITNLDWITTCILAGITPPIIIALYPGILGLISIPEGFLLPIGAAYYLGIFAYMLTCSITWFYNLFLITDKRLVDIDFHGIMSQDIAITKLQEIEEVHYTQSGFFASLFNYGNIDVQTEASKTNLEAEKVPNPSYAASLMAQYIERERGDN